MIVAVIIAGGSGHRMGQDIPKQFINVYDKPIIIYTLEKFQRHPLIDAIEVVCIDGWHEVVRAYAKKYGITKLKWIIGGGSSGQESIRNGVHYLENELKQDDILIIHDGIRPLIDEKVITNVILKAQQCGNAVTSMPYNEQVFIKDPMDEFCTNAYIRRNTLRRVSTPQAYKYGDLNKAYYDAFLSCVGISDSSYTNTMMVDLGYELYFAEGSSRNIKITTVEDLEFFKAYLDRETNIK